MRRRGKDCWNAQDRGCLFDELHQVGVSTKEDHRYARLPGNGCFRERLSHLFEDGECLKDGLAFLVRLGPCISKDVLSAASLTLFSPKKK